MWSWNWKAWCYLPVSWTVHVDHTIMLQHEHSISPLAKGGFALNDYLVAFMSEDNSLCMYVTHDLADLFNLWKNFICISTVPLYFLENPVISQQWYVGCSFSFLMKQLKQNNYALCLVVAFLSCLYITRNQNWQEPQNTPWRRTYHSIHWDKSRHRINLNQVMESLSHSIAWYTLTYTSICVYLNLGFIVFHSELLYN